MRAGTRFSHLLNLRVFQQYLAHSGRAGVDVERTYRTAALDASIGRIPVLPSRPLEGRKPAGSGPSCRDRRLVLADRDALAFVKLDRDAAKVVVNRVVITEGADVLGDRRKRASQRRKGAPRKSSGNGPRRLRPAARRGRANE